MYSYVVGYAKDFKNKRDEILAIAKQFQSCPENFDTVLKFYMRNLSRIVICFDKGRVIGAYLYSSGVHHFAKRENLRYVVNVLQTRKIRPEECAVSIFALVDKGYPEEIYYEMNRLKVLDGKENGYKYCIVNINAIADETNEFCKMSNWSSRPDFFAELTNTRIEIVDVKNEHGNNILIQHY